MRVNSMKCQHNTKQLIWLTKHVTGAARRAETGCMQPRTAEIENCHWRNRFWPKVNEPNLTRGRGSPQFAYVLLPPPRSQITTRSRDSKQRREGESSLAVDTRHLTLSLSGGAFNLGNWPNNGMYGNVGLRFRPTSSFWQQSIHSLDGMDSS